MTLKHHQQEPHSSRTWVWLHESELDRRLADGADPASSCALQARARQLQHPSCRQTLAAEIDRVLARAEHPPHWHSVTIGVRAHDVAAARDQLLDLRRRLRGLEPCATRGLALTACLLHDPEGPIYRRAHGSVADLAAEALVALGSDGRPRR